MKKNRQKMLKITPFIVLALSCAPSPGTTEPPRVATQSTEPAPLSPSESVGDPAENPENQSASNAEHPAATNEPAPKAAAPEKPRCPEGMQLVPGGTFKTAVNRQEVSAQDLCVDTFETTAAQYKECVDAGKCTTNLTLCSEQSTWSKADKQNHPMVCVDFSQAVDYCGYREKRLPETSEWEWVARGGELGRKYPWGDEEPNDQLCWQGKKPLSGTCAVGSFPAGVSAHGIHDLSGSVHEFTTTAQDSTGIIRIARGGSWKEGDPHMMWPGRIGGFETTYRCGFLGIRCVTEAAPTEAAPVEAAPTEAAPVEAGAPTTKAP